MGTKRRQGDPKRAIGYVRVSTDEQQLGPDAQRAALAKWAAREGVTLVAVFSDEGVSGATPIEKRPGLLAAVDALGQYGAGLLVAAKRDRLARDPMIIGLLLALARKAGARAISVDDRDGDDDALAILRRGIEDLFGQHERLIIKARTRAALAVKKSRNERTGDIPLGCRLGKDGVHLEENPSEARALSRILELRAQGLTVRAIADQLNADGVPARGKRWHKTTIGNVLARQSA